MSSELLIVAAFEPELEFFGPELRCASALTGIGSITAAARMGNILCERKPKRVLFVGSAGCRKNAAALLSFVSATESKLADLALAENQAYLPAAATLNYAADKTFADRLLSISPKPISAAVYSAAGISRGAECAEKLSRFADASFENLELFGVAAACAEHGIPWNAFCCVTNSLGPGSHEEWKSNFREAAKRTAELLSELLLTAEY